MNMIQQRFANLPIRRKLMIIIGVALWVSMLVASVSFIAYEQRSAKRNISSEMQVLAQVIAKRSEAAVAFGDRRASSTNVGSFELHPAVLSACLVGFGNANNGNKTTVLGEYSRRGIRYAGVGGFCSESRAWGQAADYSGALFEGEQLIVIQPIVLKSKNIGRVVLQVSLEHIQQRLWKFGMVALLIQFGAGALAYLLTARLQRAITEPLQQLETVAAQVTKSHDYSLRASGKGSDEVGVVVMAFNEMLHTIQGANHQLQEAMLELEEKRAQSDAFARSSNERREEISEYFAGVSHDLRQPLHAMGLFVETLQANNLRKRKQQNNNEQNNNEQVLAVDSNVEHLLTRLDQSIDHLEALLTDLLDVSKLDAGVKKAQKSFFAVRPFLNRIVSDFSVLAEDKQIRLSLFVCDKGFSTLHPLSVFSDPMMLERVVRNILSNAIRYTDEGGVLVACRMCSGSKKDPEVSIEIWDTGRGIAEEQKQFVFEPHHQLDNKDQEASKGFGLGLSVVKRLTDELTIPLSLYSTEGKGSVFKLAIPRETVDAALNFVEKKREDKQEYLADVVASTINTVDGTSDTEPDGSYNSSYEGSFDSSVIEGKNILLVDDDSEVREALTLLLSSWGAQVNSIGGFVELDSVSDDELPDVIVTDYNLQESRTGLDVISYMRKKAEKEIPALVVTGESEVGIFSSIESAGVSYIKKPVKPARLRAILSHML